MPKKRALETRLAETEQKMDNLKLEKAIRDLRDKRRLNGPRRRRNNKR